MEKAKLGTLGDIFIGLTYKPEAVSDQGTIVLRSGNIQNGKIDLNDIVRVNSKIKEKLYVKEGDILMCSRNGSARLVGKSALIKSLPEKMSFGAFMTIIRTDKNDYLQYYFKTSYFRQQLKGSATTTINQITRNMLVDVEVPIFSNAQSDIVVERLSVVEALINMEQQQILQYDALIKSRFVELFGDLEAGTCIHPTKKLKALSLKISDGVHAKPEYTEKGKPFLSVMNINKRIVDFTNCKFVSEEAYQKMIKSTHPQKGDVLYTKVGATYGIPAYVDTDREFCLYVSVCLIKPKHELINSKFLALQMDMPFVKFQADKRIKGIGVPDLHLNQISDFDIICPPRYMQDEFVAFVEQVDKLKVVAQKRFDETQMLFDSLMQQYFG